MDWILENIFIIIVIISGIIGFFNSNDDKDQKKQQKRPVPSKPRQSTNERTRQPRAESKVYRDEPIKSPVISASIEEQQKAQMDRLATKYSSLSESKIGELSNQVFSKSQLKEPIKDSQVRQERMKKQVVKNLGAKGLVNGIIMSEVLGPPRAKKPYQSVIKDRIR